MTVLRTLRPALLVTLLVLLPACSKKSEETVEIPSGPTLVDIDIAKKIPGSSSGFAIWDTSSDAYKRYAASPWGQNGSANLIKTVEQLDATGKGDALKPFIDVLLKTGIIASSPGQPEVLRSGVAFIDLGTTPTAKPGLGVYVMGNAGVNLNEKLAQIEQTFKDQGFAIAKHEGPPASFSIELKDKDPGAPSFGTAYFAANENLLGVVTQEALLARLFNPASDNGIATLVSNPTYKKTLGSVASPYQIVLGYMDVTNTLTRLLTAVPTEDVQEIQVALKSLPLEAIGVSQTMAQSPGSTVLAQLTPRDDEQKRWMSAVSSSTVHQTLAAVPSDAVLTLSVDGSVLAKIRDEALLGMDPGSVAPLKQQLAVLDSIKDLTIAVRNGGTASPFPEIFFVVSGSSASALQSSLKSAVNDALASFGLQLGKWQSREIEGSNMDYLMSPLGVGAFQAQVGDSIVLATSESAVVDSLRAAKDSSKNLQATAPAAAKQLLAKSSFLSVYTNFERIAALAKSVQGNLAMFTGGQAALPDETMDQLRQIGIFSANLALNGDVLKIDSRYDAAPAAADAK
ncbi:MAG: hypothetical protein J0M12_02535 [Deltaproteobacteria bacterium]|nr:hypothetical protein [Deltaproteobacteria bacterium]